MGILEPGGARSCSFCASHMLGVLASFQPVILPAVHSRVGVCVGVVCVCVCYLHRMGTGSSLRRRWRPSSPT